MQRSLTTRVVTLEDAEAPMFNRWFSAHRAKSPEFVEQDQDAVVLPVMAFAPMTPVLLPGAQNDDALPSLYESVERHLKAAGYLA